MTHDEGKNGTNPLYDAMMERRTIIVEGDITHEQMADVGQRLLTLQIRSPDPIHLIINSGGGQIFAALYICDIMTNIMTAPVRGIALGRCGSAATLLMLYCSERISMPNASFLIHSGSQDGISITLNQSTSENLKQLFEDAKSVEEMILTRYMHKLTPSEWKQKKNATDQKRRQFVQKLIARGDQHFNSWMLPEEAVKIGLVDRIEHGKVGIFAP